MNNCFLERKRKYTLDQNYFEKINDQEKAYFLGFMYADGNVHSKKNICSIKLQKEDKKILEKFKQLLKMNKSLQIITKFFPCSSLYKLSFSSKKIKQDLIKAGCIPNKTFKLKFPSWLDENLKRHFIRGFFDGDGCTEVRVIAGKNYPRVRIAGKENFLKKILNFCEIKGHLYPHHKIYYLRFNCIFAEKFLNWLYKDATIYLERKYRKYINFINSKQILNFNYK